MKVKTIRSSWWKEYGYRLDCQPYLAGALEAKIILDQLPVRKDFVRDLTVGDEKGIYYSGRDKVMWVDSREYGIPCLGSTDIVKADLSNLSLISKEQVRRNPLLLVHKGWTLITRSGTIGRIAYVRSEMEGMACQDVLRVVPDPGKILPGYLYAFLSSKFGVPLVAAGTYGAIIQHLETEHLAGVPVPRFDARIESKIHGLVEDAAELRTKASSKRREAIAAFLHSCEIPPLRSPVDYKAPYCGSCPAATLADRMDAQYFVPQNLESRHAFDTAGRQNGQAPLCEVADVFIPPIFKRRYATEPTCGFPYFTGADVFCIRPLTTQYLQKTVAIENRLILERGMIVLHEAGQRYGLLGNAVMIGRTLDGSACTNNMVRIKAIEAEDAGYIFAVLSSEHGIRLAKREGAGSSIPHIEEGRIKSLCIPWPSVGIRKRIASIADEALECAESANELEKEAEDRVVSSIEGS